MPLASLTLLLLAEVGVCVILFALFAYLWSLAFTRAPFIPLPAAKVAKVIESLQLQPGSVLYDLGSGEGRILFAAARQEPAARVIGIEKALVPTILACLRRRHAGLAHVEIVKQNIFATDVSSATHVFCYLMPKMMQDVEEKLKHELQPGARVISCDFALPTREPNATVALGGHSLGKTLFIYDY